MTCEGLIDSTTLCAGSPAGVGYPSEAAEALNRCSSNPYKSMIEELRVTTSGCGLYEITDRVAEVVHRSGRSEGLGTVFVRHTSASLTIQENADPSAKRDLEAWLQRLVAEGDSLFTHVSEGPDDMPSHIKAALTSTSLGIPIIDGMLGLGTWQGIYLWEHRRRGHSRRVLVHIGS